MYISEICIKRPVLAIVLNLILVITGIISFAKLPIRGTPDINPPIISIETTSTGASPKFMEKNVTKRIEKAIKTIKNVDSISSSSSTGFSNINVTFKISTDIENALNNVRAKVAEIANKLPKNIDPPKISKMDLNLMPSFWICVNGENYDPMVLSDIISQRIKPALEVIDSVASAKVFSNYTYSIQINLDSTKLYANKLSPGEIADKILKQNQDYPAGVIKSEVRDFIINLNGSLNSIEEFGNIIVKNTNGQVLKLKEIADIKIMPLETSEITRYNGVETITIGVIKNSEANIIDMSDSLIKILPEIENSLPEGIKLNIAYDSAVPVKASVNSVYITAAEALLLVIGIVYLFLGSVKTVIIPLTTIPISIISTFTFMHLAGFTINLYSLLAMIMSIGLVVDDAIVMLENIHRHYQKGLTPIEAALKGSKEIGFVIIVMTMTLAAVFLPIGFIEGFVGKLFIEFAWTLAFCVLVSGFVALSLSPMLCSKIIGSDTLGYKPNFIKEFDIKLKEITELYINKLSLTLREPKKMAIASGIFLCSLFVIFSFAKKEFLPIEDDSIIIISGVGAEGLPTSHTIASAKLVESILSSTPEVRGYFLNAESNKLFGFVPLKDWSKRGKSQEQVISRLNPLLAYIPEMSIFAMNPGKMDDSFEAPITFILRSYDSFNKIDVLSLKFLEEMRNSKIFLNPDRDLRTSIPTIQIEIDRDIAAKYQISLDQIGETLQYLIGYSDIADYLVGNEKYNVILGFSKQNRSKISDLSKIYVKSLTGEMVHLSHLAKINETISIESYNHYNATKAIKITAELVEGVTTGEAKKEIDKIATNLIDKKIASLEYLGDIKRMSESNTNMLFTFLVALIFIYLLLSAQFESFSDPLLIILSVPFSITGGILALLLFGSSINLYSNIGIVTLIGLITKNSIMIVEFANKLKDEGKEKFDAIILACRVRLRPILMTSLATILGATPLIFAHGASAAARSSIGLVIAGGMLIGTFFTLFVIPSIYYKFKR